MNHSDLQKKVIDYLVENGQWHRAISLDIEADLRSLEDSTRLILSVSIANRHDGEIKINNFILETETQDGELRLFGQLGEFCQSNRPLVIIGYNIMRFDNLVLSLKIRRLDSLYESKGRYYPSYWALRETLGRSYFLDLLDPVRFAISDADGTAPRHVSLEYALHHKRFSHLPLLRSKAIVSDREATEKTDKWQTIYHLWQTDKEAFKNYITGDSHDTLILAEDLFGVRGDSH